jgi:hypothetical protein
LISFLGISPKINPDTELSCPVLTPLGLYDDREYNLLMIAAEQGDLNAVNYFIKKRLDESYEVDKKIAIDLVERSSPHYSEIVLSLLKANSRYPLNFNENDEHLSTDLKNFIKDMHKMHDHIKNGNNEGVIQLIREYQNPKLRYFFALRNKSINSISAYKTAEKYRQHEILNTFKENSIIKASSEFRRFNSGEIASSTKNTFNKGINYVRQFSNDKPQEETEMQSLTGHPNGQAASNARDDRADNNQNQNPQRNSLWNRIRNIARPIGNFFASRHRKEQDRRAIGAAASSHDSA